MEKKEPVSSSASEKGKTEKKPAKKRGHFMMKITVVFFLILIVIAAAAYVTLTVDADRAPSPGALYPYTTTYDLLIPQGKETTIGGTTLLILSTGDQLILKMGDSTESFSLGQSRTLAERSAQVKTLGLAIFETNYMMEITYRGMVGSRADFYLVVKTSEQVPAILIQKLLPPEIEARPV